MHKDPEAAAALVSAHGETPGALGPLVITQSMRSLFRLTAHTQQPPALPQLDTSMMLPVELPRDAVLRPCPSAGLEACADGSQDVIIGDLSDPLDGGPCYQLYTTSFYEMCKTKLAPGGILVTQSGCAAGAYTRPLLSST